MILIVEDDPLARRALESLFAAHGYAAQGVPSAEDALEALNDNARPGMVLIDIDLPGMSGLELLRRLKREIPELPCTLMSAADHDLSPWSSQPVVPFLPKPLNVSRLFSVVRDQHPSSPVS
jgi:DNA-binding NtrC family response regulator